MWTRGPWMCRADYNSAINVRFHLQHCFVRALWSFGFFPPPQCIMPFWQWKRSSSLARFTLATRSWILTSSGGNTSRLSKFLLVLSGSCSHAEHWLRLSLRLNDQKPGHLPLPSRESRTWGWVAAATTIIKCSSSGQDPCSSLFFAPNSFKNHHSQIGANTLQGLSKLLLGNIETRGRGRELWKIRLVHQLWSNVFPLPCSLTRGNGS